MNDHHQSTIFNIKKIDTITYTIKNDIICLNINNNTYINIKANSININEEHYEYNNILKLELTEMFKPAEDYNIYTNIYNRIRNIMRNRTVLNPNNVSIYFTHNSCILHK